MPTTIPIPPDAVETYEGWYMLVEFAHASAERRRDEDGA